MLIHLHKQATTTPKKRAAIPVRDEIGKLLAESFGVEPQKNFLVSHDDLHAALREFLTPPDYLSGCDRYPTATSI
ncbi:hypothetical protein MAA8898_00453 [Maliponia aquimaris]|uniref:Uncharacterized protein n=1 Tax=Maliponia aquimaris TaxID=1673631 RepID=A0A238JRS1_9RHOB|nr:hypothetical protein MAA8898_00453 [Maliponia aquimaris]